MAKSSRPAWSDSLSLDAIRKRIADTFSFLVAEHGFQPPVGSDISSIVIGLAYYGKRVGIEVTADRKDAFVQTTVVLLDSGLRPKGYRLDSSGRQIAIDIGHEALFHRGYRSPWAALGERGKDAAEEDLQRCLDSEADILRTVFPDFLQDDPGYFDVVNRRNQLRANAEAEKKFFERARELYEAKAFAGLIEHLDSMPYPLNALWLARLGYARKRQ